jgi:hypothetical protein
VYTCDGFCKLLVGDESPKFQLYVTAPVDWFVKFAVTPLIVYVNNAVVAGNTVTITTSLA